ncbi:T9SS-dependent choice-of-anchor J family protein [Shiella aurantiaca]|nr:choice-of-anchor J domain-containing protein [Shiella aurantiaca]
MLWAQEKCATHTLYQQQAEKNPLIESIPQFENWLQKRAEEKALRQGAYSSQQAVLTVPVVVHIIHNGEALGEGSNIPTEQILNQIITLNEDFRRSNADRSETLSEFQAVAADSEIEFVLAKSDPEGIATDGIVRVKGYKTTYSDNDNINLKALSYWPAEDYLNIWVAPLSGNLLGYAQFPVSELQGLEDSNNNRFTDGVVVNYLYFGTGFNADDFSRGRTATHEIGHFFGLRHIWGDGGCSADDFCNDTPLASTSTLGCNLRKSTCNSLDMIQNYMDYTDDVCMNLFTFDQKNRMRLVLESSPRRKSLLTSKGKNPPIQYQSDVGLREVLAPTQGICNGFVAPKVSVRNYAVQISGNFTVSLLVNGEPKESIPITTSLAPLEILEVSFGGFTLAQTGGYDFEFRLSDVNNNTDQNGANNVLIQEVFLPETVLPGYATNWADVEDKWRIVNPDQSATWELVNLANNATAVKMPNLGYENGYGEFDYLISPIFDLSDYQQATLRFQVAYSANPDKQRDGLIISLSEDCGSTFSLVSPVYQKFGVQIATVAQQNTSFTPTLRLQWREETIDLSAFSGREIQLAFISQSGEGNHLYLKNFRLEGKKSTTYDAAIAFSATDGVWCEGQAVRYIISNQGSEALQSVTLRKELNNQVLEEREIVFDAPLLSKSFIELEEVFAVESTEENTITLSLLSPNQRTEEDPSDNVAIRSLVVQSEPEQAPLRQHFTASNPWTSWRVVSPNHELAFDQVYQNNNTFLEFPFHRNPEKGAETWIISPPISPSKLDYLKLGFDINYAYNPNFADSVKVLVATNCDEGFSDLAWKAYGSELSSTISYIPWLHQQGEWKRLTVDLSQYIGQDEIQIALVLVNGYGNTLYLDNIDIYTSELNYLFANQSLTLFPNPSSGTFTLSMNLSEKEDILLQITDIQGHVYQEQYISQALNQSYPVDMRSAPNGLYFVRLRGEKTNVTRKIIVRQ